MAVGDYKRALRQGRKEYQANLAKGVYPYLQVLEELTSNIEIESEVSLGINDIPIDRIVGTNSHARSTAFASNFMPLLDEDSEFAAKWIALCDIHLKEGIRDPIKCYEFMNRFYVIEGNKRVSVLKYFGAVEITGEVTRIIPRPDGSHESNIYREFLQFFKVAYINYLWFSKEGNFLKILQVLGRTKREDWDTDFQKDFRSCYVRFSNAFKALGGEKLHITVGDALLEFLKIFSLDDILKQSDEDLKEELSKIWESIQLLEQDTPVGLQMQPLEEPAHKGIVNLLTSALSGSNKKKLKIAFVHDKTKETSSWTYSHELGRMYLEEVMGDQVEITAIDSVFQREKTPDEILEELVAREFDVIFTTTPQLIQQTLKAAINHPQVKFLNCSVNMAYRHLRTYYGRMYEAKFLCGLIAGAMTKKNRIAYVADYPISGMIANINAFARGVQIVNPQAKVYLRWSTQKDQNVNETLEKLDVDMISHQDMITPGLANRKFGLYMIEEDEIRGLAMPYWNWGHFYERIIRSILSGSWDEVDDTEELKSINYWWGLSSNVVDMIYSEDLPEGVQQLVQFYKRSITHLMVGPFDGYIHDQQGRLRAQEDGYISTNDIVTMDWLIDNVIGEIPSTAELTPDAQKLITSSQDGSSDSEGVVEL